MDVREVLRHFTVLSSETSLEIRQLKHEEDDSYYSVWQIQANGQHYILKKAGTAEADFYRQYQTELGCNAPRIYETAHTEGEAYLLMEHIAGENLCQCDRRKLTLALDALISIQRRTWDMNQPDSFEESLRRRENRGRYLHDTQLEEVYQEFLELYQSVPRALCHDDLLPFNILVSENRVVLIDWEVGGLLPYPVSFARLIAHGEEAQDAFFHMSQEDKDFAIDYYYHNLLKEKGISYAEWRHTLEYFLFYELCEWVYVGHRYEATDGDYYKKYLPLATEQAQKLLRVGTRKSNYDISRDAMEAAFATYEQEAIIQRFHLRHDADFLYLNFTGQAYRICRRSGRTERFSTADGGYVRATYNECAPIFDILTHTPSALSGEFVTSGELPGVVIGSSPDASVYTDKGKRFAGRCEELREALAKLGGQPYHVGDVSAIVPMFDFFPVMVQFWDGDDEFDPVLKLMWDKHSISFMRYESIAIAGGHLIRRIMEYMDEIRKEKPI